MEVVFVHGMMGGGWYWENYASFFKEKGFSVHTPYLRYHDGSPEGEPPQELGNVSVRDYVEDILNYIKKNVKGDFALVGHSMGGLIVQLVAQEIFKKENLPLRKLVLLTPAPPRGVMPLSPSPVITFLPVVIKWGWWKKPFKLPFWSFSYSILNRLPRQKQKELYRRFVWESGRALFEIGFWFMDSSRATEVDFKSIKCPTLVVLGRYDKITPPDGVRKTAEKLGAELVEFDSGHWVVGEDNWKEIASTVLDFVKG